MHESGLIWDDTRPCCRVMYPKQDQLPHLQTICCIENRLKENRTWMRGIACLHVLLNPQLSFMVLGMFDTMLSSVYLHVYGGLVGWSVIRNRNLILV